jgi:uroporphyrinogen-III synthase
MQERTLAGCTVAVPESRELELFAAMLERRGATVLRCPLVVILDAPDPQPVLQWIRRFNAAQIDDLILLTGEGLTRLLACIDRNEPPLRADFLAHLGKVRKITRGPKPARALRELGLKPDIAAATPTTPGVIAVLREENLAGRCVGVQLYGSEPNQPLIDFLISAGARPATVSPYIYADKAEDEAVSDLLHRMADGRIDIIAFTSSSQVNRLFAVGPPELVERALGRTQVAAVGPVVAEALARHGVTVRLMPQDSFFMKPLTSVMADALGTQPGP